ncbi:C4-dicarboxylate ABC transporter [Seohaeicola zhoushanensis]|uniref:C4-dicarboxylate ABC transporter n=2 Tax=Seohaeicola zhoushanensis TaxID=1569283 RepID=A0A8J3GXW9_9RHOB|nr:C4-dicarboxylate ABC transporter [Seohaeicola zhoushanensis]
MMKKMLKATGASLAIALAFMSTAHAGGLNMTSEYELNSLMGKSDQIFADKVGELSKSGVEVTLHLNGSLGLKSADNLDAVSDGVVDIADTLGGVLAGSDPIFLLSSLPFIVSGPKEARALYDAARPAYEEFFRQNGQILLYASPWLPSGFWANKPIDTVESLNGWKLRTYDANGTRTMIAAGASPIQLSWADVVPQLATGGIDGVLTSSEGGATAKFDEHLSHFTEINYALPLNFRHMNAAAFESLPEDQQKAIREAAAVAEEAGWAAATDLVEKIYTQLGGAGVTIVREVQPELRTHLNDAAKTVIEDWRGKAGEAGAKVLHAYGEAVGRQY